MLLNNINKKNADLAKLYQINFKQVSEKNTADRVKKNIDYVNKKTNLIQIEDKKNFLMNLENSYKNSLILLENINKEKKQNILNKNQTNDVFANKDVLIDDDKDTEITIPVIVKKKFLITAL